jgi:hypothetical protein
MPFRSLDYLTPEVVRTSHKRFSSSALGRTRTCGLLIRSHSPSQTETAVEGQGRQNHASIRVSVFLRGQGGTGRDTRLRSDCGRNGSSICELVLRRRVLIGNTTRGCAALWYETPLTLD